ncbi:DEAD/DEAH box helicase [Culicoidibacter larvae]|uniref:DEAD/DEAH box helicase n=1 Tax=Culicoidibacter larvae TaxID=2579976 RepID=A0A5R8QAM6_9FIRM|nr:DEAD/DEAH box helicase [Culicoidibacter larvae]TLG72709.1 DEAD/DEAH box helicase [Culicoidibacter larvae]
MGEISYGRLSETADYGAQAIDIRVENKSGHYICRRCGNQNQALFGAHYCLRCEKQCLYCRQCIAFGKIRECSQLYVKTPPHIKQQVHLGINLKLSAAQQKISDALLTSLHGAQKHFIWSVAGSGKTEMTFQLVIAALQQGKNICWAIPRRDIVIEIYERFKAAFIGVDIIALYGGSPMNKQFAPLVVSTTHQLLHFHQAFDLIIVDEHDAFPYKGTDFLEYAVQQSLAPEGSIVLLSATPSSKVRRQLRNVGYQFHILPARYHGFALPEPRIKLYTLPANKVPAIVRRWLQKQLASKRPILLFAPSIKSAEWLQRVLQPQFSAVESVHSQDEDRNQKIADFRDGAIAILVTTTILERGITIANVAVGVFNSQEAIFDEAALVQIAGRVGRKIEFPTGEIVFFASACSYQMLRACWHIKEMNRKARKLEMLHE